MPKLLISQKKIIEEYVNQTLEKGLSVHSTEGIYEVLCKRKHYETLWCDADRYASDYECRVKYPNNYTDSIEQFRKGFR